MSRVFEALNKATRERERQTENVVNEPDAGFQQTLTSDQKVFSLSDSVSSHNGTDHSVSPALPKLPGIRTSWRERIEELFFGWDLRRYATHPIVALEEESPASEQYKILREQIKRLRTEAGVRTIAITSPVKRDGKTTVAVNLAAAIALEHADNVLLIDADLRAPSVHRYFNHDISPGLADYLGSNSQTPIRSFVRQTQLSGLQIVPAGKPSRFSSELLANKRMARLFNEIQIELPGHVVIIDSPPVLATPDPLVLGRQVDGVIMVVRAGKTPKDYLVKALSSFTPSKVLGVVLNGAEMGLRSKYYYYYSRSSHE